ncbi:MAG: MoaD/ThiS family protein [Planctomycetota bacterium]
MVSVQITGNLQPFFPDLAGRTVDVEASTVAEVVQELERRAPGFAFYVCDELGRLRRHVNVFIDNDRVLDRTELSDRVEAASRVFIVQALSGG